jgi:hypothetical protein
MSQFSTRLPDPPIVAFLTDYGVSEGYVGVLKGVVLGIVPHAHTIDLTHEVAPLHIASGAWHIAMSYRYFPKGTVFVCVVDPGVGSTRHPIAVHAGDWYFVGPDNGLFSYIFTEQPIHQAVALDNTAYHLPNTSYTFHGRDIFAPAGAHIARGIALTELGSAVEASALQRLDMAPAVQQGHEIIAHVLHTDHYGNIITNIPLSMVPTLFSSPHVLLTFPDQNQSVTERRRFFAEGSNESKGAFIYGDSSGNVGVAVCNGDAASTLGVGYGATVTFTFSEK